MSVGDAYKGALIPSLMLVGLLVLYVLFLSFFKPESVPALPAHARTLRGRALARSIMVSMVPAVVLIFLVLGTIFIGPATPTEGGAMGAVGALARRRLSLEVLHGALATTTTLSTFVMFILIGSTVFGLIFRAVNGDLWVEHLFGLVPGGQIGFLLVVSLLVFVPGCFIDFFEIAFILLPLFAPVVHKPGIDMVWFLVMVGMNMQASFLTPSCGFALFYLRSVAPVSSYQDASSGRRIEGIGTMQIYRGLIPFIALQIVALGITAAFPAIVTPSLGRSEAVKVDNVEITVPEIEAPAGSDAGPGIAAPDPDAPGELGNSENRALMDALGQPPEAKQGCIAAQLKCVECLASPPASPDAGGSSLNLETGALSTAASTPRAATPSVRVRRRHWPSFAELSFRVPPAPAC